MSLTASRNEVAWRGERAVGDTQEDRENGEDAGERRKYRGERVRFDKTEKVRESVNLAFPDFLVR